MPAIPEREAGASVPASVCMATYNGERFLPEQLDSILRQLRPEDELVVVDDASVDGTFALLSEIDDPRVVIHRNPENLGYVRTFERAMTLASRDVLLLSDQDDIWIDGRRDRLVAATGDAAVVASDLLLLGSERPLTSPLTGRPWRLSPGGERHLRNELLMLAGNAPYFGCAMALRRDALELVLPFPSYLDESHDLWIATVGNATGAMRHMSEPTILRRIHDSNTSPSRPRGVAAALRSRVLLLRLWREAARRRGRSR
ncbi:glycosyltransferase involved in cell wall biosynthesis [Microbacterium foliorum]|uniref:glycosyltransferase n=1 Tax=Microbacterium foliorum TaxID=104336 RepID=UPI00209FFD9D|nr:glycosyltransferase [Microbacterium foliorum]MCP1429492.1 glycosyltransferase involved in cell wall biosynthesis [Microbacterium foliorum]